MATRLALGPSASPRALVTFGAGAQIAAHITLLLRYYSESLNRCTIYNRSLNARVQRLIESLRRDFASVTFICRQTPDCTHGAGDDVDSFRSDLESTDIHLYGNFIHKGAVSQLLCATRDSPQPRGVLHPSNDGSRDVIDPPCGSLDGG